MTKAFRKSVYFKGWGGFKIHQKQLSSFEFRKKVPSMALRSTLFLCFLFFFSEFFLGNPPPKKMRVCLKLATLGYQNQILGFSIPRYPKEFFPSGVEVKDIFRPYVRHFLELKKSRYPNNLIDTFLGSQ